MGDNSFSAQAKGAILTLAIGYDERANSDFIKFYINVCDADVSFKVYEEEEDFAYMANLLAVVQINASNIATKFAAAFA